MNPAWQAIATFILRRRIPILIVLAGVTAFMWSVRGTKIVQNMSHGNFVEGEILEGFQKFRQYFGDDANVMVVSFSGDLFEYETFAGLYDLTEELGQQDHVAGVFSLTRLYDMVRQDSPVEAFHLVKLIPERPRDQAQVDSIKDRLNDLPFYEGLILDKEQSTTLIAVSFVPESFDTELKFGMLENVQNAANAFGDKYDIQPRFAGLPVWRVTIHGMVRKELSLFLFLALLVTALTLFIFFRSFPTVLFPMIVVGSVIIFSLGLIGLFDYEIGVVMGIIPALVTVISIPNSVYLITKYHIEYRRTLNKMKSLILVIEKIGIVTVMTNATTAIGLGVLAITDIPQLRQFGIVAGLSVVAAFFISLLLIPIVFSFLPPPNARQTKHLDARGVGFLIRSLKKWVGGHRWAVYAVSGILVGLSLYGMTLVQPVAFIVDDMPQDSEMIMDLRYVENKFNGALPFEILIDTKQRNGAIKLRTLKQISALQDSLDKYPNISRSISMADFAKFFNQAFFNGDREYYELPSRNAYNFIGEFARNSIDVNNNLSISKTLFDSTMQVTRVSASVRDIGSLKMEALLDSIEADVDSLFDPGRYDAYVTGTSQIFTKNNAALIENLLRSLFIAFCIIAIIMGLLFRSLRMVVISLVPNFLPLIMVAGLMGFFDIALKPSTALVFGVAFGIAVDDSIHFLARYRLARRSGDNIRQAVLNSYDDTGVSMIYTSIILFIGFVCFTASDYGGTKALGLLTSLTLAIAMFSNLVLLPALLLTFDKENGAAAVGPEPADIIEEGI
jgi:predicted RND superfamily exporter protein